MFFHSPFATFIATIYLSLLGSNLNILKTVTATTPYYTTTDLGTPNPNASIGNPLKGFLTNPDWNTPTAMLSFPASSLEFYYIGLNDVMTDYNTFDWDTHLEDRLNKTASRNRHSILRFVLDTPAQATQVPQFLIDDGLQFNTYPPQFYGGGVSPDYNDPKLKIALMQFIEAFAMKYDGDKRVAFVQVGLLGFWGEWHTYTDGSGVTEGWIPESLKKEVVERFQANMTMTEVQVRYPFGPAIDAGFGLHDDSFAYATLDGSYNGGVDVGWFFWTRVIAADYTNFWQNSVMGGEIYPPLQNEIFSSTYLAGTPYKQDYFACTNVTHATYILNNYAFSPGYPVGNELDKAIAASQALGYDFLVTKVSVAEQVTVGDVGYPPNGVTIMVEVMQAGVAPFYYPLNLTLSCTAGMMGKLTLSKPGVELISIQGSSGNFTFTNVPADPNCLGAVTIGLSSGYMYPGNPVKFSQGVDGTNVTVNLPLPCIDSVLPFKLTWNGKKIIKDCSWVGKNINKISKRCAADGISAHCSNTCKSCASCVDSTMKMQFFYNGKMRNRNCIWVAKKTTMRCNVAGIPESCCSICR